jgi:hypothetical protein
MINAELTQVRATSKSRMKADGNRPRIGLGLLLALTVASGCSSATRVQPDAVAPAPPDAIAFATFQPVDLDLPFDPATTSILFTGEQQFWAIDTQRREGLPDSIQLHSSDNLQTWQSTRLPNSDGELRLMSVYLADFAQFNESIVLIGQAFIAPFAGQPVADGSVGIVFWSTDNGQNWSLSYEHQPSSMRFVEAYQDGSFAIAGDIGVGNYPYDWHMWHFIPGEPLISEKMTFAPASPWVDLEEFVFDNGEIIAWGNDSDDPNLPPSPATWRLQNGTWTRDLFGTEAGCARPLASLGDTSITEGCWAPFRWGWYDTDGTTGPIEWPKTIGAPQLYSVDRTNDSFVALLAGTADADPAFCFTDPKGCRQSKLILATSRDGRAFDEVQLPTDEPVLRYWVTNRSTLTVMTRNAATSEVHGWQADLAQAQLPIRQAEEVPPMRYPFVTDGIQAGEKRSTLVFAGCGPTRLTINDRNWELTDWAVKFPLPDWVDFRDTGVMDSPNIEIYGVIELTTPDELTLTTVDGELIGRFSSFEGERDDFCGVS